MSKATDPSFNLRITAMADLLDCRRNFFISSSTSFSIVHGDIEAMVDRERLFSNLENIPNQKRVTLRHRWSRRDWLHPGDSVPRLVAQQTAHQRVRSHSRVEEIRSERRAQIVMKLRQNLEHVDALPFAVGVTMLLDSQPAEMLQ